MEPSLNNQNKNKKLTIFEKVFITVFLTLSTMFVIGLILIIL